MTLELIQAEFDNNGRLSRQAISELRSLLLSNDPYSAITVAADTGCTEVSAEIAQCLDSADAMVRWNAAATLFTRFRVRQFETCCIDLLDNEQDEIVRSVALVGLGELLLLSNSDDFRRRASANLLRVLNDQGEYPEVRGAAYEGILAAVGIPPSERPPVHELLNLAEEVDWKMVKEFGDRFG